MKCDDAFERMTSVTSAEDPALARHLARCPRCRQMHETLSPALHWFADEASATREQSPWEHASTGPVLTTEAVRLAEEVAWTLPRRRTWSTTWRKAAAILVVACLGVTVGALGIRPSTEESPELPAAVVPPLCAWQSPELRATWAGRPSRDVVASCVLCHVPQDPGLSRPATL
jgi:hypothetical protein